MIRYTPEVFPVDNEFQYRLQKAIAEKGITASELSRLSGVGKADISNYINGKYLAKADKVVKLAHALGVDPGWLMTGEEPVSDEYKMPAFFSDSKKMLLYLKAMPFEDYKMFIDILRRAEQKLKDQGVEL